jgi:hypothetical protein
MRIAEPRPLGLTFSVAMTRAMVAESFVYRSFGGNVDTVVTCALHFSVLVVVRFLDDDPCNLRFDFAI